MRRGVTRVALQGEGIAVIVARLQDVATDVSCGREELLSLFSGPERDTVDALIRHLISRKLAYLEPEWAPAGDTGAASPKEGVYSETNEDIFFMHAGRSQEEVRKATATRVALVGVNSLSLRVRERMREFGQWDVDLIDDVALRNHALCEEGAGYGQRLAPEPMEDERIAQASVIVACSEFGGQSLLMPWNSIAIDRSIPFLPVLIEDLSVYVGPLVIPGETPCLACLASRQNSNLKDALDRRAMEPFAVEGQRFVAAHPAIVEIAGSLAAFEVLRFSVGMFPRRIGRLIEFNLVGSSMIAQRVLKAPRCPACSTLKHVSKLSLDKRLADVEAWENIERMGGAYAKKR